MIPHFRAISKQYTSCEPVRKSGLFSCKTYYFHGEISFRMHKVKLLLLFSLISFITQAQLNKGQWLVGGSVAFESKKYTGDSRSESTVFQFMPNAGYFFMDKLAGGMKISFSYTSIDGDSYRDFLLGPFARYYFLSADKPTNIFLDGHFLFGSEKYENFDPESKTRFGVAAGPAFFLNPHVALEAALYWQSVKHEGDEGRYNSFGVSVGLQVHLSKKTKR